MNKLILVGNGFDLAHGLKTSYTDFILWYLNKSLKKFNLNPYNKYEGNLMTFDHGKYNINRKEFSSIYDFHTAIKTENLNVIYKNDFIKDIMLGDSVQNNWVDIESKYYSALVKLYKRLEKVDLDRHPDITKAVKELNKSFDFIKFELSEYLLTIDNKLQARNQEVDLHFHQELIKNVIDDNTRNSINNIKILNFNYTSTIELYNQAARFTINYIHGKLGDTNNPIIFGYGDEMHKYYEKIEQLDSNDFLMNIKSFNYFKTNNYQDFIGFIDSGDFEVIIMGHSCGLSDRILLNSIFEHEKCKRIRIYYYEKDESNNDYFEKTQQISRHFKPNSKGGMRKKIISFPFSKPLVKFKS